MIPQGAPNRSHEALPAEFILIQMSTRSERVEHAGVWSLGFVGHRQIMVAGRGPLKSSPGQTGSPPCPSADRHHPSLDGVATSPLPSQSFSQGDDDIATLIFFPNRASVGTHPVPMEGLIPS